MANAIPTTYASARFRSRLEARWAAFFDAIGWQWEYEPIDLAGYIPDFVIRTNADPIFVEVKPIVWADGLGPRNTFDPPSGSRLARMAGNWDWHGQAAEAYAKMRTCPGTSFVVGTQPCSDLVVGVGNDERIMIHDSCVMNIDVGEGDGFGNLPAPGATLTLCRCGRPSINFSGCNSDRCEYGRPEELCGGLVATFRDASSSVQWRGR